MKSWSVTIQMKFTKQYFPVVPVNFIMLYKVVIILESVDEILKFAIRMKAIEQHFLVTLFIILNKGVLSFECMREILWSDHWNERSWAVLSFGTVHYVVQSGSCFWVWMRRSSVTKQMKVTEEYFPVVVLIMLYEIVLNFEAVDEIRKCDHIN